MRILLFEDTDIRAKEVLSALENALGETGTVERFQPDDTAGAGAFEPRLLSALQRTEESGAIDLIVADWDLSKTQSYLGLSEGAVRRVAASLAIPECSYSSATDPKHVVFSADQREERITVSIKDGPEACAKQIKAVADGFAEIRRKFADKKNDLESKANPGEVLAAILEQPQYAEKFSLYASGDRQRLHSVLQIKSLSDNERARKATWLFGYWLWDSVLRYPGVLVNQGAAASYLNIEDSYFRDNDVQSYFHSARYKGPFAMVNGPLWWRGMLDDLIAEHDANDGREVVAHESGSSNVPPSRCCDDPSMEAGYYCMLSQKPVSFRNSVGGLAWFPRGADLARISRMQDEELGPWLS